MEVVSSLLPNPQLQVSFASCSDEEADIWIVVDESLDACVRGMKSIGNVSGAVLRWNLLKSCHSQQHRFHHRDEMPPHSFHHCSLHSGQIPPHLMLFLLEWYSGVYCRFGGWEELEGE